MRTRTDSDAADPIRRRLPRVVYSIVQRTDGLSLAALDAAVIAVAWLLAFLAGFESSIPVDVRAYGLLVIGVPVGLQLVIHKVVGLYGPVWRYASVEEGMRVIVAVALGAGAATVALVVLGRNTRIDLPLYTAPPVAAMLMLLGCGGVRFQARLFALERTREAADLRALIVGAGSPGAALAYELAHTSSGHGVRVVGFVDDDPRLSGRSVRGLPVLGGTAQLAQLSDAHAIDRILVAMPDASKEVTKPIIDRALRTGAQVKVLRPSGDATAGLLRNVRDLDLSDLLGRQPAPVDSRDIADYLTGATVLVTGAGGSIGSEISRQVARYGPRRLLLLDRDETLLHDVAVGELAAAETVLLDIADKERLTNLLEAERPEVVFHAAANKHVPILERHAAQAATVNVLSTWWLANAAAQSGCRRFVHLSTDKAAHPCSVMGATKRAAEQVVVGVGRRHGLPFAAVRFGNVLGSRGSVVPTFLRQILSGGPVTVTSAEMTRYFMTIPEAVSLVLQSGAMADDGRIFLLDMGEPASIMGIARQMIRLAGLRPDKDIAIEITGMRPGERLHERLHDEAEEHEQADHPSISGLRPKLGLDWDQLVLAMDELEHACAIDDAAVRRSLMEMLRSCGVDCRLSSPGATERAVSPTADVVIDLDNPHGTNGPKPILVSPRVDRVLELDLHDVEGVPSASTLAILTGVRPDREGLPFVRPARPALERVVRRLERSYASGQLTNGCLVRELEERVASRLQVEHVVAVSSCTSGLMLAVQALVDGRPGPVVLPSFTFSASAHAVVWNGRTPRFVECDPDTFQIDLDSARRSLDGASAIMATHIFGAPCNPEAVEELAASAGLPLLFDAAHAIGASSHGRPVGGFGDAEVFSLTPTKPMVAGEGGLVATNDDDLAARLRVGRDYGNPGDYNTLFVGLNARMSEFHAAVALESLAMFDATLEARRDLAERYARGLRDIPGVRVQEVPVEHLSTYKDLTIAVDSEFGIDRNQLVAVLAFQGIDTRNYFDPPVHRQQAYSAIAGSSLPTTDVVSQSVVSLPIYPALTFADVDAVVATIRLAHEHAEEVRRELDASRADQLLS